MHFAAAAAVVVAAAAAAVAAVCVPTVVARLIESKDSSP